MKLNMPLSGKERRVPENDQLVSSTDLKGRITHCNPAFIDISGFDKDELLGASHNVVRHPEMPPVAFQNLWDTLKSHRPWMGIVKNRSKNGDHYWVDAFVTPVYEGDSVVGYESVRVKPEAADVERASRLYDAVSRGRALPRRNRLSLRQTLIFSLALLGSGVAVGDVLVGGVDPVTAAESWGAWSLGAGLLSWFLLAPLQRVVRHARDEVDNPVLEQMYTGAVGDMPTIELASRMKDAQLRTVLGRVTDSTSGVQSVAAEVSGSVDKIAGAVEVQEQEISMLATAMEEMSASVSEIARSASEASKNTREVDVEAEGGKAAVAEVVSSTRALADEFVQAADSIRLLEHESEAIDAVLVAIRSIAEQTNLLALNAAIEAARAGEQGRGFAVVADEVRTLASRSQESTEEIQAMIESLQAKARSAVAAMQGSSERVARSVDLTEQVDSRLDAIFSMVGNLEAMNHAIATAAEEQSAVSNEIARNVNAIGDASAQLAVEASTGRQLSGHMAGMSSELEGLVRRFRS
jgi:aerotaxis receptor